jgi:hypothetical protein
VSDENIHVMADGSVMDDARRYRELKARTRRVHRSQPEFKVCMANLRYYETRYPHLGQSDSPTRDTEFTHVSNGHLDQLFGGKR